MSRTRRYGSSKGMLFQFSTMTFDEVPIPSANRPGAACTMLATLSASVAAPRVKAGTMAVPSRSDGVHAAASASGVNASAPPDSADHRSVYPSAAISSNHSRCACSGTPSNGTVMP